MTVTPERWAQAYAQHHHTVVLAMLANGVRLDEARELAHDAWARIFEQTQIGKVTNVELPGLIIRQAYFLWVESRRRESTRGQRNGTLDEAKAVADPRSTPEDTVSGRELLGAVQQVMAAASPRQRSVLSAVVTSPGAQHADLAKHEGVSLQRFRQVLCEVRSQLRAAVGRATQ